MEQSRESSAEEVMRKVVWSGEMAMVSWVDSRDKNNPAPTGMESRICW